MISYDDDDDDYDVHNSFADTFHINPQLQLHVAQQDKVGLMVIMMTTEMIMILMIVKMIMITMMIIMMTTTMVTMMMVVMIMTTMTMMMMMINCRLSFPSPNIASQSPR